ncbi:hypothetical protein AXF42_Ash002822 [Apostasia shenzhenica]|uniref:Uncharacterized protein n=1 Tax=Apostasia shenzhenica TaxID=1088818 RepID=A0A2I0A7E1_9ASPA|nr:hypothetical protein AXF42_Ash002822 [Apostasia shenzhenica]
MSEISSLNHLKPLCVALDALFRLNSNRQAQLSACHCLLRLSLSVFLGIPYISHQQYA